MQTKRAGATLRRVTAEELFESPAALIGWAYDDTQRFREIEHAFFGPESYEEIVEFDEEAGMDAHRLRFVSDPPDELRKLASHIVNDLRHSLDQSFSIAAKHFGWQPSKSKKFLYFPWATDAADLQTRLWDIPKDIHDIIIAHQPYYATDDGSAGSNMIRELNNIAGPNKHEAALGSFASARMKKMSIDWNADWLIPFPETMWDSAKKQLTYGFFPTGTKGHYDGEIAMFITFRDVPALNGVAARKLFEAWGGYAQSVVSALEERVADSL